MILTNQICIVLMKSDQVYDSDFGYMLAENIWVARFQYYFLIVFIKDCSMQ